MTLKHSDPASVRTMDSDRAPTSTRISPGAIRRLLHPTSIAVVGASDNASSIGGAPLHLLDRFGYRGDVYPVNQGRDHIGGRACFRSIDDLPFGVDAAILVIPKTAILSAIEAASRRGIGGVIVFASGFAEVDEEGAQEQRVIAEFALRHDIALAGPNCLGLINFAEGVPLTFGDASPNRRSSRNGLSILAQSGAMTLALTYAAMAQDITVNYAISTGNEAVLGVEDYLGVILHEEGTGVIALLVEQIRQPEVFLSLARVARERGVALCVLHLGRGERARAASITHTGALAQDQAVLRAILGREGVLFIDSLDELIDTADVLTKCALPLSRGVGLLTDSGAMKTFALDVGESLGLSLPVLAPETSTLLAKELPAFAVAENPVDITAMGLNDPTLYARATNVLLDDAALGSVVLCVMPGSPAQGTQQIEALLPTLIGAQKPVIYTILGGESAIPEANRERIVEAGIPLFRSPDRALRALKNVTQFSFTSGAPSHKDVTKKFLPLLVPPGRSLNEREAKGLLAGVGVRVPVGQLATSETEVIAAAAVVGFPLVLKVSSSEIVHKSDVGGVSFVVREEDLLDVYRQMLTRLSRNAPNFKYEGVLVESAAPDGTEMIVGAHRDPIWGTFVLVGAGGMDVESQRDVVILSPDADHGEIVQNLSQLRVFGALSGARGPSRDIDALVEVVEILGGVLRASDDITEIEVNPLLVLSAGAGAIALDALIVTRH